MKMTMMMPGWSAHGGQTLSPYVGKMKENENILGHSVGAWDGKSRSITLILNRLLGAHLLVLRSL